ncbi:sodium:calcium antiporter, partial [Dissulfurirhabdus thermomarina]|nr:sodium:calcium antiporter [Dissulfurirhabdus thermomarina]
MLIDAGLLLLGLALLVGGGEVTVRGASALAREAGVPPVVVGLTVVAFGTSAPELAVNVAAAVTGRGGVCFGNIVGSNLANIGLILGTSALLRPIRIRGVIITREIPMMLLATAAALVLGFDGALRGLPEAYDRADGLVLVLLFGVFLYYTAADVLRNRPDDA